MKKALAFSGDDDDEEEGLSKGSHGATLLAPLFLSLLCGWVYN